MRHRSHALNWKGRGAAFSDDGWSGGHLSRCLWLMFIRMKDMSDAELWYDIAAGLAPVARNIMVKSCITEQPHKHRDTCHPDTRKYVEISRNLMMSSDCRSQRYLFLIIFDNTIGGWWRKQSQGGYTVSQLLLMLRADGCLAKGYRHCCTAPLNSASPFGW